MNDFTKEELEFIKHAIREHYKNKAPIKGSTYVNIWADMINKIQSMIDNYCEHESSGQVSDVDFVEICTQCKELTGWV